MEWKRIHGGGLVEADWWRRINGSELVDLWKRISGGGLVEANQWKRIHGSGGGGELGGFVDAD